MRDKGFNQFSTCFSESRRAAEISSVRFNQFGIEVVLPDQHTQSVPQFWLSVIRTVRMLRLFRLSLFLHAAGRTSKAAQLFDGAEADPISLAESAVDGARFGDAHLGPANTRWSVCSNISAVADAT